MHALEFGKGQLTDSDFREEYDKEIAKDARYFESELHEAGEVLYSPSRTRFS
jgi:hypothetical protein